ncbi:MAG TPA: DUF2341 domain-containing protein [Verrucomicrobiae bacterium]|jgi:hypothetical protein|nr:DUF2341 domain-containing protein [Verrucomicrobiae bacterium]
MQKKSIIKAIAMAAVFAAGSSVQAQPAGAYFQAVTNLDPAGYWPLNETAQPPAPFSFNNTADNLGSLGAQGIGYYGAWYQPSNTTWYLTNSIVQSPAVTAPFDNSAGMNCQGVGGQYVIVPRTTNGVINTNLTLTPPFSIEAWLKFATTNSGLLDIVGEGGFSSVNYGGPNTNNPFYGGPGLGWAGVELGAYQNYCFFICNGTNAVGNKAHELDSSHTYGFINTSSWIHVVATFDGTTESLYTNGVLSGTLNIISKDGKAFVPDPSTPLMIGSGSEPSASYGNGFKGVIDDVAIYNEVLPLSSIDAHYQTAYGTNATFGTNYPAAVLADSPTFYYRLNDSITPVNAGYPTNTFPVATNYGTLGAAANGVYQPGAEPGVAGPSYEGFGASSKSVAINGWFGAVDVGGGSLPPALNPTGASPLTLVTWFRGNIADSPGRFQELVGHGDSSYRLALGQATGENHFNPGPGPEITNAPLYQSNGFALNDGNWHMVAGVSDGTNDYLYLDGILAKSSNTASGINIVGNTNDLLIGGDSEYTYASWGGANTIRDLDGQIAHVAFWTNALSAAQIQSLFNAAGVPASVRVQPVGATNNQGASVTVTATVAGSQPITYQWYQNGSPVAGQTGENLTFASIPTNATGSYYLVAGNSYGPSVTSSVVQIFVYGAPSVVTQPTSSLEIFAGQSPVLSMSAVGAQPISYQWTSNGVVVSTAQTYTIPQVGNGGTYVGTAINSDGSASTAPITLTVVPTPTAPYPAQVLADHPMAFWRLDESSGDIAYDYVGGNNGIYSNVALAYAPSYNPVTDPSEGNAPYFGGIQTNDSYVGSIPTNISFTAPTNVNAEFSIEMWAQQYSANNDGGLAAIGVGYGGEEFALDSGGFDPAHDLRFYVNNAGGANSGAPSHVALQSTPSWHHVVAVCDEANKLVSLYIDGTNAASTAIAIKSGIRSLTSPMSIGARISGNGDNNYDNQYFGLVDEVAVYNYALTSNQVAAHYLASGVPPVVTQLLPVGIGNTETTNVDATASFTVEATGTAPLYYFWTGPSGTVISTNQTLSLPNVQTSAQGLYSVVVSNAYGVTQPAGAYLSVVLGPPQISQDISPLTQTVQLYAGEDQVSYTVVAIGSAPFSYQWYQNGTPVSGATNQTYTFIALPGTNSYYVTVTNAYTASQNGGVPAISSTAQVIASAVPQLIPANYPYKTKITFPGYSGAPLTNFPALITLSSSTLQGLDYTQFETNGADIRFTDASGTSILPSEIDEWNDNGVSTIWVMVPLLNGTNIWAYWGNASSTNTPPASTNVWIDSGYEIVYHLKETQPPYADSTGQYPATVPTGLSPAATATTQTNGVVGHGQAFNGTSSILSAGAVTLSNQFTTYVWAYLSDSAQAQIQTLWCNQEGGYGANGFSEFVNAYNIDDNGLLIGSGNGSGVQPEFGGGSPHAGPFFNGNWYLLTCVCDAPDSTVSAYLNGELVGTGAFSSDPGLTNTLFLGAFLNPNFWWTGTMDEARIQYGLASTNWVVTTYANMANSSFVSLSALNQEPFLSITSVANSFMLSWPTNDGTFTLEATTNLASPSSWAPVSSPTPTVVDGNYEVTIPTTGTNEFYRLVGQ